MSSSSPHSEPHPRKPWFTGLIRLHVVTTVTVLALVGAAAPSAFASDAPLPCTERDTSAAFAPWLDPAQYFLAANGGFEAGADNWDLTGGAAVVSGNETFHVNDATDEHSLVLPTGAGAASQAACVTMGEPTVRLFVKAPRVLGAALRIDATVTNPTTGLSVTTSYVILGGVAPAQWAPTPQILIANAVGGIVPEQLTVRITAYGAPAEWGVDDVFVDPYKHR